MGRVPQEGMFEDESISLESAINEQITDGVDRVIRRRGKNALTREVPILGVPLLVAFVFYFNS